MNERDVELIDYLRILWRQKWVIVATLLTAVIVAWATSRAIAPTYQTETSLLLLPPLSSQLNAEAEGSRLAPEAYRELSVSTSLLEAVKEKAGLPEDTRIDLLEDRFIVSVKRLSPDSGGSQFLLKAMIRGPDADQLPEIASAWTELFTERFGELFQDRTARSFSYVSANHAETEAELERLIEERLSFLADHPIAVLRAEVSALDATLLANSMEILRLTQELQSAEAYLTARDGDRTPQLPTHVLTSEIDPYTLLGAIVLGLSATEYRDLIEVRINDLEQRTEITSEELVEKQQQLDSAEAGLGELNRRITLLEQEHASLTAKLQDARIALAETPEPIRVIDEPLVPRYPIAPRKGMNIAIAGVLGLMVGTLLAFFVDYLARVREEEAATQLGESQLSEQSDAEHPDESAERHRDDDNEESRT